jgi:hypothetical protein
MSTLADHPSVHNPQAALERALFDEYLALHGETVPALLDRADDAARALLRAASLYAAGKLTEVESRAHYVQAIRRVA